MASAQVLYYLVFRLHINLMQLFVCKNTGTMKHSGTKFNVTAIICNSNTSIYCADLSSTWPTKQKAKILTIYKCVLYRQKKKFLKENLPYKEQSLLNSDIKTYCRQTYIFAWNLLLHAMYLCTWDWLTPYMPVHVKVPPTTIVQKVCLCRGLGLKLQSEGKEQTNSEY